MIILSYINFCFIFYLNINYFSEALMFDYFDFLWLICSDYFCCIIILANMYEGADVMFIFM